MELLLKEMTTTEIQKVTVFHSGIKPWPLAKVKSQKLIIPDMQHMHMEYIM